LLLSCAVAVAQPRTSNSNIGYIDSAIVADQVRVRYDSGYGINRPDRAEFFYAKCGCFRNPALQAALGPLFDPDAQGPIGTDTNPVETNIDYQDIWFNAEKTLSDNLSAFVEVPVRFLDPDINDNTAGLADVQAGFKLALYTDECNYITFQLRTYVPTGDADRGLGTHHVSLEPALLAFRQLGNHWYLEGEFRDWIPIDGSDFAGNVLRYGVGLSYDPYGSDCACDDCGGCCHGPRIVPVLETVGWTVLNGLELPGPGPSVDASGTSIVNLKAGLRLHLDGQQQIYAGYGRAVTGDIWYQDIFRVEYRMIF